MSGLLPRISPTAQNGNFVNLQAVSLNASYAVIGTLSLGTLNLGSLTIASIAGDPNLLLTATSAITLNAGASTVIIPAALVVNNASTVLAINGANNLVLRSDVVTAANSIVFSNKTIDSATNTITITNAPLAAANVNTLINQAVQTTSSPTFVTVNATNQFNVNGTATSGVLINQTLNLGANTNGMAVQSGGVTKLFVGHNQSLDLCYFSSTPGMRILTGGGERIRILASGIALDNTPTSVLALNGTTLVTKNDVATAANSIVFSNKTIDSATNTITITNAPLVAANINTLINQDVETTASPAFVKLGLTNQSMGCLYNTSLNLALSPIIAANVFVNVATTATQTLTPGVNFTASNVSITYTGVPTKFFIMSYSATVTTLLNGFYQMRLTRNGAPLNQSIRSGHLHNANTLNNTLESTFIQQLAQNDVIQMQIANNTNTTVLNVQFYTITALELFS